MCTYHKYTYTYKKLLTCSLNLLTHFTYWRTLTPWSGLKSEEPVGSSTTKSNGASTSSNCHSHAGSTVTRATHSNARGTRRASRARFCRASREHRGARWRAVARGGARWRAEAQLEA